LRQWRRSGQSVRVFCAEHDLQEASFYSWRRIIEQRDRQALPHAATLSSSEPDAPAFVPVQVVAADMPSTLEVVLGSGRVVRVPVGFDAATLTSLLAVLEVPAC
jgi:hypothetical protein